ncbi:prepilin-type N-terminal cleavage/methylation domain-containing protein [bacterium]|nr:prepilin-type N-terminal cleavage/methylation domain-containing protein [bacterium]
MFKKSFTLSEIMIAMTVLGIIVAACVPIILNMTPNKNAIMLKKAYYATVDIVKDLVNDPVYYPDEDAAGNLVDLRYIPTAGTLIPGTNTAIANQNRRFRCLFVSKLNVPVEFLTSFCNPNTSGEVGPSIIQNIIQTPDGLLWNFHQCPFGGSWDEANVCRIDVSVGETTRGTYSAVDDMDGCNEDGPYWIYSCSNATVSNKLNTVNKAAFFIYPDGVVALNGTEDESGFSNGQPVIQSIIDGRASLLGKGPVPEANNLPGNGLYIFVEREDMLEQAQKTEAIK